MPWLKIYDGAREASRRTSRLRHLSHTPKQRALWRARAAICSKTKEANVDRYELIDRLAEELPLRWVEMCRDPDKTIRRRARVVVSLICEDAHASGLPWDAIAQFCDVSVRGLERWRRDAREMTDENIHHSRTWAD